MRDRECRTDDQALTIRKERRLAALLVGAAIQAEGQMPRLERGTVAGEGATVARSASWGGQVKNYTWSIEASSCNWLAGGTRRWKIWRVSSGWVISPTALLRRVDGGRANGASSAERDMLGRRAVDGDGDGAVDADAGRRKPGTPTTSASSYCDRRESPTQRYAKRRVYAPGGMNCRSRRCERIARARSFSTGPRTEGSDWTDQMHTFADDSGLAR